MNHRKMISYIRFIFTFQLVFISLASSQSTIFVFEPNGGEDWKVGSQHTIQWLTTDGPSRVNIEYSTNGGANWAFIATNIVSPVNGNAQYNWTIPDEPSQDCFVKVSDAVDGDPFDTNDAPFTISRIPGLDIIQPNGGETWQVGSAQFIRWSSVVSSDPAQVKLEYSVDGGINWIEIVASTPNSGEYAWAIPATPSQNCLMAISDAADGVPSDTSDNLFTISPAPGLELVTPNGGEIWMIGTSHSIEWQSVLAGNPANVKLEYSVDGGSNWLEIVSSTSNDGSHIWTVPNNPSENCVVKVSDAVDGDPFDISDDPFTISPEPALILSAPNGGETWIVGTTHSVEWQSVLTANPANVKLEYSIDGGNSWLVIIDSTPNDGQHLWTIPDTPSNNCVVKIADVIDPDLFDVSDNVFVIEAAAALEVTGPASGTSWTVGEIAQITWNSFGTVGNVKIDLSRNNGASWITLVPGTANDGNYGWTVMPPRSGQCRIRIQEVQNPAVEAIGPLFSIIAPTVTGISNTEAQPAGNQQTAYRLISVPLRLDNGSAEDVLVDDLGAYNNEVWRFFDYQNGNYSEFPNVRNFAPGRSYFLIVREAGKIIDAGSGEVVADSVVTIPLSAGWNFIANPFLIDLPVSSLSISDNLITFDGSWSTPGEIDVLEPWKGYALRVEAATTLAIRYPGLVGTALSKKASEFQPEWRIQIRAKCQEALDDGNFAGVMTSASQQWDECDYYEPPPIGEYLRVYFPHREWKDHQDLYTGDFREIGKSGYRWDFEIQTPIQDVIELKFEGIEDVPDEFRVILLDPSLNKAQDLRENPDYSMFNHRKSQIHQLSLVVGSDHYIRNSLDGISTDVSSYELLDNYPNPFNSTTTISFAIPVREKVILRVFNSLGEEVTTLIDGAEFDSGFYRAYWNGQDQQGRAVASGIYIYRLTAGSYTVSKKMLLVK